MDESAGDLGAVSHQRKGGRDRGGRIRPDLSRFADGLDNSGAGERRKREKRFALERIGQSTVCI